jgi:hypothetical protein
MNIKTITATLALTTLAFTLSAQAHSPSEHMQDAEAPNCATMETMDHSKMKMDDPMMQAMMKQCTQAMHEDDQHESESPDEHMQDGNTDHTEHKHR